MALTVGVNSWVTVAEADTYFSERYGASAWAGLANATKQQLLIHAFRWIQQQSFFSISPASTADIVKQAQMELAWYIYNYFGDHEKRRALQTQGVKSFRISKFSENYSMIDFPPFIKDMLDDFLTDLGGYFPQIERPFGNNQ